MIFRDRRPDRNWKFTKPLLYRLSYVGACFLIILALRERVRECSGNSRLLRVGEGGGSPPNSRDQLSDEAGVRLRRVGVRFWEFLHEPVPP